MEPAKPGRGRQRLARFARMAVWSLALGFVTTLGVCAGAVVWNARSTLTEQARAVSAPSNVVVSAPKDSPIASGSVREIRYRGLAVCRGPWNWNDLPTWTDIAAIELKEGRFGTVRSDCFAAQPLWYHAIASEPQTTPVAWSHGGSFMSNAPIGYEWRWIGAGWPCIALQCDVASASGFLDPKQPRVSSAWKDVSGGIEITGLIRQRSINSDTWLGGLTFMPLTPNWLGLGIDSALYGFVWYVLMWGRVLWLERQKSRIGRCPGCGYDLRGIGKQCPECGSLAPS